MYMNSSRSQALCPGTARLQPSEAVTRQMFNTATRDGVEYGQVTCSTPEKKSRNKGPMKLAHGSAKGSHVARQAS